MNDIGFGCSKLTSNFSKKQAIRNLEVAYDNGITHFDVARLYGQGIAESILGEFLRYKRSKVTVTTKTGLFPNSNGLLKNLFLQNVAKIAYKQIKKIGAKDLTKTMTDTAVVSDFSVNRVRESIQTSLKELNTPYIDYLLLHEATIEQTQDAGLTDLLDEFKNNGQIKSYGIASYADKIKDQPYQMAGSFTVLQTNSSYPVSMPAILTNKHIDQYFYFSPLLNLNRISDLLKSNKALADKISDLLNFDAASNVLDILLMQQNRNANNGTFLFTSSDDKKIKHTTDRWRHIQTISVTPENFERAKILINAQL